MYFSSLIQAPFSFCSEAMYEITEVVIMTFIFAGGAAGDS